VRRRRYLFLVLAPLALVAVGTVGYSLLEPKYSPFDALYMTVITLTTVGYEEVYPLGTAGRVFTIFLLLGGVFTFFYTASEIIRVVVSGEVRGYFGRRRMERSLAGLRDHLIICGYGRMGRVVCREFSRRGVPFVVVDRRPELLQDFDLPHGLALAGDATDDAVLQKAGVARARALVAVTPSDADNLFITLSARLLSERLFIVARAEDEPAEHKLKRAGANRVVSPYASGGFRVAQAVLRPTVVDFIELATGAEHLDLQIEEVQIQPGSPLAGSALQASRLRLDLGVIIVAIKRPQGHMVFNPPGDAVMEAGDTLIALGGRAPLDQLEALAGKRPDGAP
jgi:voltage-gated potassium channel